MMVVQDYRLWVLLMPSSKAGTADPGHSQMKNDWIFGTRHVILFLICYDTSSASCPPSRRPFPWTEGVDFRGQPPSWLLYLHQSFSFSGWPVHQGCSALLLASFPHPHVQLDDDFREGSFDSLWHVVGHYFCFIIVIIDYLLFCSIGDWAWGWVHGRQPI